MNKAISAGSKFYERNKLKESTIWNYFIWNGQESVSEEMDSKIRKEPRAMWGGAVHTKGQNGQIS